MKILINLIFGLLFIISTTSGQSDFSLKNFPDDKVMVVAHRGNWREAPENSIWAVKKALEYGANMAEIDLTLTKDSILILMHDKTIDRTTTGKGKPEEYTLEEIKQFYLRDGAGHATQMRIPTLEEVLIVSKGKIFLNLDKGFDYIDLVYPMLKKHDMIDEVLFKGSAEYKVFNQKYGHIKDDIVYMPIIRLEQGQGWSMIEDYLKSYQPFGFEFTVGADQSNMINFKSIRDKGIKVWVNSLWPEHNAGHHDDKALENPNIYDWYIDNSINIIQTDRIKELTDYLRKRSLLKVNDNI